MTLAANLTKCLASAVVGVVGLTSVALAQDGSFEPTLDKQSLERGLLALMTADPAAQDDETAAQMRNIRTAFIAFSTAVGDGPEADRTLKLLQEIGREQRDPTPAEWTRLEGDLDARMVASDATADERAAAIRALQAMRDHGTVPLDDFASAAAALGIDAAGIDAAVNLLVFTGTNGSTGTATKTGQTIQDTATAFGAYEGQNGGEAAQRAAVKALLGGMD